MMSRQHYNVYLSESLMRRICQLAETTVRTPSDQVMFLVSLGLRRSSVPLEWGVDAEGNQSPTDRLGGTTVLQSRKATFRAPETFLVDVDNFRADNDLSSFSEAVRVLLTAGLASLDANGCDYCQGAPT